MSLAYRLLLITECALLLAACTPCTYICLLCSRSAMWRSIQCMYIFRARGFALFALRSNATRLVFVSRLFARSEFRQSASGKLLYKCLSNGLFGDMPKWSHTTKASCLLHTGLFTASGAQKSMRDMKPTPAGGSGRRLGGGHCLKHAPKPSEQPTYRLQHASFYDGCWHFICAYECAG
jgi:hypothetical protein